MMRGQRNTRPKSGTKQEWKKKKKEKKKKKQKKDWYDDDDDDDNDDTYHPSEDHADQSLQDPS